MCRNKCKQCIFRGDSYDLVGCDYATITGHVRGAIPPEECTHFRKGERITKAEYRLLKAALASAPEKKRKKRAPGAGKKEKYDWSIARKLYDGGKNDGEIGREMGINPRSVKSWRNRNDLPANTETGGRWKELDWGEVRKLYDRGKNDKELAAAFGVSVNTIFKWRHHEKLPARGAGRKPKHDWDAIKELYDAGMNDKEIERKSGVSRKAVWKWRNRNKLPPNVPSGRKKSDET